MDSTNRPVGRPPHRPWPVSELWRFINWFLERLYEEWSWGYDLVANITSIGQWWRWQEAALPALPSGRLLELGFGTGRLLNGLLANGQEIYGLDRSRQMVERTAKLLAAHDQKLPIIRGDARHLPFPSKCFTGIVATFPSDYFFDEGSMAEMGRVLAKEGKVVVIPFALITGKAPWDRIANLLYRVTGQSPRTISTTWLDQLTIPGFELSYRVIEQKRAKVLQVSLHNISEKPQPKTG